ncbi:MAG TPA: hypothetical protein VIO58_09035 [Candidatus Methanoperedens sp.]
MNSHHLSFDEIITEIRDFYKGSYKIKSLSNSERQIYLTNLSKQLEQCLTQILELEEFKVKKAENWESSIKDWDSYYTLIGHFFEGFIKTILMIENFDSFFLNYYDKKKSLSKYENAKQEFITFLNKKNLDNEQVKRIRDVLDYVQMQRNNFVHFPLKTYDHYAVKYEMYMVIKKLCEQNKVKFSEEIIQKLNDAIERESYYIKGMKFKDVWSH